MNKNIIFALREHNHIDHLTPIIDIIISSKQFNVKLLFMDESYKYESDINIKYLKNKYKFLKIYKMYSLYFEETLIMKYIYKVYRYLCISRDMSTNFVRRQFFRFPSNLLNRILKKYKEKNIFDSVELLIKLNCDINNTIVVTDHAGDELYSNMLIDLKKLKITSVGLIHGVVIFTNKLLNINELYFNYSSNQVNYTYYLDYIISYNSLNCKHILEHTKKEDQDKILQFPSLRYTSYWLKKKSTNTRKFKLENDNNYTLKIVYMISSNGYNIWVDEEFRTLKMILGFKNITLVVKPHPRTIQSVEKLRKLNKTNLTIVDNTVSSSALIEWSDIIMLPSSSIVLECLINKKPIFYMKYLHCNTIDIEKYHSLVYILETRDDVIDAIKMFLLKPNIIKINKIEFREYLKDYILNDDFIENSKLYLDFFKKLTNE